MGVNSYYSIECFGERLHDRRQACGMTQKELAAAIGVEEIQIRRYENGRRYPTLEHFVAIVVTLEASFLDFVDVDEKLATKISEMEKDQLMLLSTDPRLLAQAVLLVINHFQNENEWLKKMLSNK